MSILDSPLSKAGKVKGIYIRTHKNILISVNPKVRRSRTAAAARVPACVCLCVLVCVSL